MQYWITLQYRRPRNGWSLLSIKSKMVDWTAPESNPIQYQRVSLLLRSAMRS